MLESNVERAGDGAFPYSLHGGDGLISAQWYFRRESRFPAAVQRWTLPPGASEGMHAHPSGAGGELDEIYVLLDGRAVFQLDGEEIVLAAHDAVLAPAGVEHGVRNEGPGAAEFIVVWGPPGSSLDWARHRMGEAAEAVAGSGKLEAGGTARPASRSDPRRNDSGSLLGDVSDGWRW